MKLEAGYRVVKSPRLAPTSGWPGSIEINGGVVEDGGRFFAKPDWRPIAEAERPLLVDESPRQAFPTDELALIALTERLRARWWDLAEAGMAASRPEGDWFPAYAREIGEYAAFKGFPFPASCALEVLISPPEQRSTRLGGPSADLGTAGLGFNRVEDPPRGRPAVLGGCNLGDEPAHLLYLNLPPARLAIMLGFEGRSASTESLTREFFARFPEYPIVRLTLRPGEGYWMPTAGMVFDGDTLGVEGVSVALLIGDRGDAQYTREDSNL